MTHLGSVYANVIPSRPPRSGCPCQSHLLRIWILGGIPHQPGQGWGGDWVWLSSCSRMMSPSPLPSLPLPQLICDFVYNLRSSVFAGNATLTALVSNFLLENHGFVSANAASNSSAYWAQVCSRCSVNDYVWAVIVRCTCVGISRSLCERSWACL